MQAINHGENVNRPMWLVSTVDTDRYNRSQESKLAIIVVVSALNWCAGVQINVEHRKG